MALKVVPAGDERCDIHNKRSPPKHVCESCLKEFGVEPTAARSRARGRPRVRARRSLRRWRSRIDKRMLIGAAVGLAALAFVVASAVGGGGGGGGGSESGGPSQQEVVNALDLLPNPSGTGWITSDGACAIVSIDFGKDVQISNQGAALSLEATNQAGTVGAVVTQNDFTVTQADCVDRVSAALRANF